MLILAARNTNCKPGRSNNNLAAFSGVSPNAESLISIVSGDNSPANQGTVEEVPCASPAGTAKHP